MRRQTKTALGVVALLLVAGCIGGATPGAPTQTPDDRTIQVVGSGSAAAEPNKAVLEVGVVARAADAATARQQLAENVTRMRQALSDLGLDDDQVTTSRYDIYRDRRPPERDGGAPTVQYRALHEFEITLTNLDRVGTVIDTAVRNGATEVQNVRFTLSSEQRRALEADARQAAMADARAKARSLARPANLTITGVDVVRTDRGGGPRPYEAAATATPAPTESASARSDVEAGPVTVVATVHVTYGAEQTAGDSQNQTAA